jgi:hypothetical protein
MLKQLKFNKSTIKKMDFQIDFFAQLLCSNQFHLIVNI